MSMKKIISFVCKQLNIHSSSDLYRSWDEALDMFFYFNKKTGCGVPSIDQVKEVLYGYPKSW